MPTNPAIKAHHAWLGYLQPDGLVVSAPALVDAQVLLDQNTLPLQQRFLPFVGEVPHGDDDTVAAITDFPGFAREFLKWPDGCLFGLDPARPLPESLHVPLPEFSETLAPSFAFQEPNPKDPANPWLLFVQLLSLGTDLDAVVTADDTGWAASPSRRFERLLRETKVPIGLLTNGTHIRLMYAPRGENVGSVTFLIKPMTEVAGRPILAAFDLLLNAYRLLAAPSDVRLPVLLAKSRQYQSTVSTQLASQVLDALYELLRGFQAADERAKGELLCEVLEQSPDDVYAGLLTVLMRLVFLLYAEDRGLMPSSSLYVQHYSVHGLFERLRGDYERYPDTMDHRYGAWAQLLAVFRAIHSGCKYPQMLMPARSGYLFDPNRFLFLEGRTCAEPRLPLVADGTIFRVLQKLLILDGERLSYRTLDVEEIGSVYQTVMGFRLEVAASLSIAILGKRKHKSEVSAPTVINLEALLSVPGKDRTKWLKERTDQELSGEAERALRSAVSIDDLLAALERKIARNATPLSVPRGAMLLQPTDERRRSGSHYTPRSFTEPIVRTTLRPILQHLGEQPTPDHILNLKVCDMAVGSAAFLVETCRQLGDELIKAWHYHGQLPVIPPDEDEVLLARRLIAQRCLYGVDRNPMAVDLAKLSLWLATLAKDHPFTFLDHAIRCGDSLVGLTRRQIADFHWREEKTRAFGQDHVEKRIREAIGLRLEILAGGDYVHPLLKREKLDLADERLEPVRFYGDLIIAAFFNGETDKQREANRKQCLERLMAWVQKADSLQRPTEVVAALRGGRFPVTPFHWEIEFPEVFDRENPGFDAIMGNPPFAGKNTLINGNREGYLSWLKTLHEESHGAADLVAHFFRRALNLLRPDGCFGLIATNTIGQGDTRATGLRWISTHGGTIYAARKRCKWPGQAAVVVSIVHVTKGGPTGPFDLDGRSVLIITAYLFHAGTHENPALLRANAGKGFKGCEIGSLGFVTNPSTPEFQWLCSIPDPCQRGLLLKPYLGGKDLNSSPIIEPPRYVIDADGLSREDISRLPKVLELLESRVRPDLLARGEISKTDDVWWHFRRPSLEYRRAAERLRRILGISEVTAHFNFAFVPNSYVPSHKIKLFGFQDFAPFSVLQSRVHEVWSRLLSSTMKDDLNYSPTDCFETFPFPAGFEINAALEQAGQDYYELRAALMMRNHEGLTKTYNRFHDPEEQSPDILRLRELHATMDCTVLDAYGWTDIPTTCDFFLDYEDENDDGDEGGRRRKKPWRYRWSDEIRDEVLARLLKLNAERAEEEKLSGQTAAAVAARASSSAAGKARKRAKGTGGEQTSRDLFNI